MKLISFDYHRSSRFGVLEDDVVIDLPRAHEAFLEAGGPVSKVLPSFPVDMLGFVQGGPDILSEAKRIAEWVQTKNADPGLQINVNDIVLKAPLSNVSKVIGIGLNYADHCRE